MQLGFNPTTASILNLEDAFKVAQALDLDFLELAWEFIELAPDAASASKVRDLSRATGVHLTLHLPFVDLNLASLLPEARSLAVKRVQRGLAYAEAVGARCAVLHTGQNPFYFEGSAASALGALHASLTELEYPVQVALENLSVYASDLLHGPEALKAVTDEAGLKNCLDFGHAHLEHTLWGDGGEHAISRYLEALGERIIHLHLHGNDGSADQHCATSEGTVPFAAYGDFLRTFPGTLCLEVAGGLGPLRESVQHVRALAACAA